MEIVKTGVIVFGISVIGYFLFESDIDWYLFDVKECVSWFKTLLN
jgi:hypothetical protein